MDVHYNLNDLYSGIVHCNKCNACVNSGPPDLAPLCPMYEYDRSFTFSPGGLCYVAKSILNENLELNQLVAEIAYSCSGCGVCTDLCNNVTSCKPYFGPWDIIRTMRSDCVKKGIIPEGLMKNLYDKFKRDGDFLDNGEGLHLQLPEKIKNSESNTTLYAQCFHVPTQIGIYKATLSVLEKIGKPISLFSDGGCCGSTSYDLGFWENLDNSIKAKWKKMNSLKDNTFLFVNPHCFEFIKNEYPTVVPESKSVKKEHISERILSAIESGKLATKNKDKITVSYHDPCYLGRKLGIFEPPRKILTSFDGVELKEMKNNRENSFCCGSRTKGNYHQDFSRATATKGIENFIDTGADILITACPYCKQAFKNALPEKQKNRVMDLVEFVDKRSL